MNSIPQMIGQRKIIRYVRIDFLIARINLMISMHGFNNHHSNYRVKKYVMMYFCFRNLDELIFIVSGKLQKRFK